MRTRRIVASAIGVGMLSGAVFASGGEPAPSFASGPTVVRTGAGVRIEFAVDRETDVAVFIEDRRGKTVRHLAAGVLGENPPPPLKPGLAQSIVWDGKANYGKPVGEGPFKVRVALELGATFDRIVVEAPQNIGAPKALAVGPDGTLYVCVSAGANVPNWSGERIVALDRNGRYVRTVLPYPANLDKDEVAGYGVVELDGRPAPLWKSISQRRFHSALSPRMAGMTVTDEGTILKFSGAALSAIGVRGTTPWGAESGPELLDLQRLRAGRPFVCVASDGKRAFVTGLADHRPGKKPSQVSFASVYAVALPERGPGVPFFGEPEEPGSGTNRMSDAPRGMAVDGRGHLLVADFGNDRVVVLAEADGAYVGEFAVPAPDSLGVDPATGAVYVWSPTSNRNGALIKFSGWREPKELSRRAVDFSGNKDFPPVMALDAGASPALIWLATDDGDLLRFEDRGDTIEGGAKSVIGSEHGRLGFVGIEVDRFRPTPEIYFRNEIAGGFGGDGTYFRYLEGEDRVEQVRFPGAGGVKGTCIVPGPDGVIYAPGYSHYILRYTRDGKPLPWPEGNMGYPAEYRGKTGKLQKIKPGPVHGIFGPVSMTFMTHTLGVRPSDGHFFFFDPGQVGGRPTKMLREYTPDGRLVSKTPIIWKASDNCIGPKFDQAGNIYVAEQVKPVREAYPDEFVEVFGRLDLTEKGGRSAEARGAQGVTASLYGSIVKFGPKGGKFHFEGRRAGGGGVPYISYYEESVMDASLRTEPYASFYAGRLYPLKVTGAEWVRMGISHQALHYCNCENTRFDVDEFGRVWYPDLGRFRVTVLDTAGNEITRFGGYGNAENRGPESKTEALKNPDIPLAWLIGVGATDRYVYMGDSLNRRLLRAKQVYAAEKTLDIK